MVLGVVGWVWGFVVVMVLGWWGGLGLGGGFVVSFGGCVGYSGGWGGVCGLLG